MSSTYVPKSIRASATRSVWLKSPSAALRTSSAILVALLDEALETRVIRFNASLSGIDISTNSFAVPIAAVTSSVMRSTIVAVRTSPFIELSTSCATMTSPLVIFVSLPFFTTEMGFRSSLSTFVFRLMLPLGLPAGLPDWPGLNCVRFGGALVTNNVTAVITRVAWHQRSLAVGDKVLRSQVRFRATGAAQ